MIVTRRPWLRTAVGLAETVNVLMVRLALRDRGAAHRFPGVIFREYMALAGQGRWRSQSIFEFLPELREETLRITLEHLPGEGIETPIDELAYLALITRALKPGRIFEIGTFRGRTALNFALNSPRDCEVLTLDLPDDTALERLGSADRRIAAERSVGAAYGGRPEAEKIVQLWGDSTKFDFAPYAGNIDVVFVDGGHTYEICYSDTMNAMRMCRPGGVIVWHDWANFGEYHDVTRAVLDLVPASSVVQLGSSQLAAYRLP